MLDKTNTAHPDCAVVVRVDVMAVEDAFPTADVGDTTMLQLRTPSRQNEKAVHVSVGTVLVAMTHCSRHSRWSPTSFLVTKTPAEEAARVASWRAGLLTNTSAWDADGIKKTVKHQQASDFGFGAEILRAGKFAIFTMIEQGTSAAPEPNTKWTVAYFENGI